MQTMQAMQLQAQGQMLPQMTFVQMVPVMQPLQGFPSNFYPVMLPQARAAQAGQVEAQADAQSKEEPKDRARSQLHRMLQSLEQGRDGTVQQLKGHVARLSRDKVGCRVVQRALELARDEAPALALEMVGSVKQAVRCPNGNFVIQKIVTLCEADFVAQELLGKAADVAKHRYGCRVACRIVERRSGEGAVAFISELLERVQDLSQHAFAHHAMQSILEHGAAREKQRVASALRPAILANAQGRSSSYVVASALECCDEVDQDSLVLDLLEHLPALTQSLSGCHVIKALLAVAGPHFPDAAKQLQEVAAELSNTRHGRRIIQDFNLAQHW